MNGQSTPTALGKFFAVCLAVAVVGYFVIAGHSEANPPPAKTSVADGGAAKAASDAGASAQKGPAKEGAKKSDARVPPPVFMPSSKSGVFVPAVLKATDSGVPASADGQVPAKPAENKAPQK